MSDRLELTLRNDISEVARVIDAVEAFGERHGLPAKKIFQLNLALDELVTNVISYGFEGRHDGEIGISVVLKDGAIEAELVDNGKAFNPVEAALPELGDSLDDRLVGGLGLKFVRTYMDRLDYRRDGEFNRLRLHMDMHAAHGGQQGDE